MRKLLSLISAVVMVLSLGAVLAVAPAAAHSCTTVYTSKGTLTAAEVGGSITGSLDAAPCQIGVYFNAANPGSVNNATISGATWFGIFVDGNVFTDPSTSTPGDVSVDITNSTIQNIGETPFNGAQHGNAIYYYGYNAGAVSGAVSGNTVSQYQKGGIIVNGENANVSVTDNTVTGLGPVDFIAQNGVQFGFGANGVVRGNSISDNYYIAGNSLINPNPVGHFPPGKQWVSGGLLLYQPGNVKHSMNHYSGNQINVLNVP